MVGMVGMVVTVELVSLTMSSRARASKSPTGALGSSTLGIRDSTKLGRVRTILAWGGRPRQLVSDSMRESGVVGWRVGRGGGGAGATPRARI